MPDILPKRLVWHVGTIAFIFGITERLYVLYQDEYYYSANDLIQLFTSLGMFVFWCVLYPSEPDLIVLFYKEEEDNNEE